MSANLDAARRYLERGWSVVPLVPRTKRPAVRWQEYQRRLPTADEVTCWWTEHPDAGIGIVTGAVSGLVVVDVDPRNGGDTALASERTPTACVAITGGGGLHLYVRHPGRPVPCGKTALPGVDRKGDGGFVVAPPSIHPDGGDYTWMIDADLGDYPAWLDEAPASEPTSERSDEGPWIAETLANPQAVKPGGQEETLSRLAWWASGAVPFDIASAMLTSWAQKLPLGRPAEPWTRVHVDEKLERAYAKRGTLPPSFTVQIEGLDEERTPNVAALTKQRTQRHVRTMVRTTRRFAEEAAEQAAKQTWLVRDFVAPGCWTEIIGVMKEGKSTFVSGMLRALLDGQPFLDRETQRTKVLYVSEQVGMSFNATLKRGKLDGRDDCLVLTVADFYGKPWAQLAAEIVEAAIEHECGIIVIDTLGRLANLADEDEARSVACLYPLIAAKAAHIAVIFVRHARKSGGAINVAARGSGAITGEMDVCLYIQAKRGVSSDYRYLDGVSRLGDTITEHLTYQDGTYVLGPDPDEEDRKAKRKERKLSLAGALQVEGGATAQEIAEKTGIPVRTVRRRLADMKADGEVRVEEGRYVLQPRAAVWVDEEVDA